MPNIEHPVESNVFYIHKMDHRDSSHDKSQWTISEMGEINCFHRAFISWRCLDYTCWGLYFENGKVMYLGTSQLKKSALEPRRLFVAKFIDSNRNGKWHGYPADHVLNKQDIPPETVRATWLSAKLLRPAAIRKLSKRQRCKL